MDVHGCPLLGIVWLNLVPHSCTHLYSTPSPLRALVFTTFSMSISDHQLIYSCPDRPPALPNYSLTQAVGLTRTRKKKQKDQGQIYYSILQSPVSATLTTIPILRFLQKLYCITLTTNPSWPVHTAECRSSVGREMEDYHPRWPK